MAFERTKRFVISGTQSSTSSRSRWKIPGAVSLFVGASLIASAGVALQYLPLGTPARLNPSALKWLSQLKVDVRHPLAPLVQDDLSAVALTTQPPLFPDLSQLHVLSRLETSRAPRRQQRTRHTVLLTAPLADAVETSLAAPEVSGEETATPEQLEKFQNLSQLLRRQFLVASALDLDQINDEVTTQVALTPTESNAAEYPIPLKATHLAPKSRVVRSRPVLAQVVTVKLAPAIQPSVPPLMAAPLLASLEVPANRSGLAQTAYDMPIGPQPLFTPNSQRRPVLEPVAQAAPTGTAEQDEVKRVQSATEEVEHEPSAVAAATTSEKSIVSNEANAAAESSHAVTEAAPLLISQLGYSNPVTTQAARPVAIQPVSNQPAPPLPLVAQQAVEFPDFVKQETPVKDPTNRNNLTHTSSSIELPGHGWDITRAANHWPTLSVRHNQSNLPMVSNNSALVLAATLKASLLPEAGIVFGRVPAGWGIQFSGRAERPLFISMDKQFVSADVIDRERFFVLLNAAPGTQSLQLIGNQAISGGIVTLPVLSGTATYIDLTRSSYKTVSGYALDAASDPSVGLKAARVQIMGQPGSAVWTDAKGYFQIKQVLTLMDHPVQIDIQAALQDVQTHTHRFSVHAEQFTDHAFYLFSETDIKAWEETLQGVNPEAGMIIGAAPRLARSPNRYSASISAVSGVHSEAYSLAPNGQMLERTPLDSERPRFISLEVGEGPTHVQLTDESSEASISELVYASPRTINILSFD